MAYSADVHRLQEDAKQQVLSQHLAAQLSYYAAQPTSTRKRLGRVVISGKPPSRSVFLMPASTGV